MFAIPFRSASLFVVSTCVAALLLSGDAASLIGPQMLAPSMPELVRGSAARGAMSAAASASAGSALHYVPSGFEREWAAIADDNAVENRVCERLLADGDEGFTRTQRLVRGLELQAQVVRSGGAFGGTAGAAALAAYRAALADDGQLGAPLLSRLCVQGTSSASACSSVLEPLVGALRDPRWLCAISGEGAHDKRNKALGRAVSEELGSPPYNPWLSDGYTLSPTIIGHYFLLDPTTLGAFAESAAVAVPPPGELPPRAYYFDAGASFWGDGFGVKQVLAHFAAMGLRFDAVYAWEKKTYNNGDFFADAPASIQHLTHYVNMPVTTLPGDRNNPLVAIALVARPQDYVVLKLDVDNSSIELALVEQLAGNATLLALVDEFFFEDHVDIKVGVIVAHC